jgi:hypothetical protein
MGIIDEATGKLMELGILPTDSNPNLPRTYAEILWECSKLSDTERMSRSIGYGAGYEQIILIPLTHLLDKNPEYRTIFLNEAKNQLNGLDIKPEHIEEYFRKGNSLAFTMRHENDYDSGTRDKLYEKANHFALGKMREWLGFQFEA